MDVNLASFILHPSSINMSSPKRSKKPSVPVTKIPALKDILERLGFQHASVKDVSSFQEATHTWRKGFKASSGRLGPDLLRWNNFDVQLDLKELAEKFLVHENIADQFWGPARSWNQDSNLKYPEDRAR